MFFPAKDFYLRKYFTWEVKMAKVAFLKLLTIEEIIPELSEIEEYLIKYLKYEEIRPFNEYVSNGDDHDIIVWRFNREDTVPDSEINKLCADKVIYLWRCKRCQSIVASIEYPNESLKNLYYGCACIGTVIRFGCKM